MAKHAIFESWPWPEVARLRWMQIRVLEFQYFFLHCILSFLLRLVIFLCVLLLYLILNNCVSLFSLQPLLGAIGLFCVFLSVMSSYGICSMLGLIFSPMHNMIPFLLMGKSENCAKTMISFFLLHKTILVLHMWLEGCPNPNKMEQSWECTFLKLFKHMKTKWASKKDFIIGLQNYQLIVYTANQALMNRISHAC